MISADVTGKKSFQQNHSVLARALTWTSAGAVFLFPSLVGTVDHAGSVLLILLVLVGLVGFRGGWGTLDFWEKALLLGFAVFFAAAALSLFNADDLKYGIQRLEKLARILALIPIYLTIRHWKIDLVRPFFYGCLLAGPLMLVFALVQKQASISGRVAGAYNPIVFGDLAMVVVAVLGASLLNDSWRKGIWPATICALFCALTASTFSWSRGAWLVLPVLLALYLWALRRILSPWLKVFVFTVVLVSVVGIFSGGENIIKTRFMQVHSDIVQYQSGAKLNTSTGVRLLLWGLAVELWQENPVIGTGLGDYRSDVKRKMDEGQTPLTLSMPHAHNIFFDFLATAGIVGLLAMIAGLLLIPTLFFLKINKKINIVSIDFTAVAGLSCILCFTVFGLTESWTARTTLLSSYMFSMLVFTTGLFQKTFPNRG